MCIRGSCWRGCCAGLLHGYREAVSFCLKELHAHMTSHIIMIGMNPKSGPVLMRVWSIQTQRGFSLLRNYSELSDN